MRALPSSVLIDRKGNLVVLAIGPRAWDTKPASAVIETLLNSWQCDEAQPSYPPLAVRR